MQSFEPIEYKKEFEPFLIEFLEQCLPESERALDLQTRHRFYLDIEHNFKTFRCMFDDDKIIGAVGVKDLGNTSCELKSLYLLEKYHGMGYGKRLLGMAIDYAKDAGYEKMYLDSLSTSTKAIRLYRRFGFTDTERYNENERSDVFMLLDLKK